MSLLGIHTHRQVQDAIERVFSALQEARTARAAAQLFLDAGVRVPVRWRGRLGWQDADYSRVQAILKNPMIAGLAAWPTVCGHCGRAMGNRYNKSWR